MSLLYKKYQNKSKASKAYGKWYGHAVIIDNVSTKQLADEVSHATTVTYADVIAVLAELTNAIKAHLQNSHSVTLDGIGRFKVGISTSEVADRASFSANNIKRYRINYQPEVKFQPNGKVSDSGKRLGTYVNQLLNGITAREFGISEAAANGGSTSGGQTTDDTASGGATSDGDNVGK